MLVHPFSELFVTPSFKNFQYYVAWMPSGRSLSWRHKSIRTGQFNLRTLRVLSKNSLYVGPSQVFPLYTDIVCGFQINIAPSSSTLLTQILNAQSLYQYHICKRIQTITNTYDSMQLTAFLLAALTVTTGVVQAAPTYQEDYCFPICYHDIPKCRDGWYSNNLGTAKDPCWTCCKAPEFRSFIPFAQKGACN
jgi:hypothetical protein